MQLTEDDRSEITAIVADILEIDPAEMTRTSLFKEDHDADSLGAIEILAALEKTFRVAIRQEELSRMVSLEGVYAVMTDAVDATGFVAGRP